MILRGLIVILALLLADHQSHAAGELIDPEICSSREKDFVGGVYKQPDICSAPHIGGGHPELRVKLVAKQRPIIIPRYGNDGVDDGIFRIRNAYSYLADPRDPTLGSIVPPVLRPNVGDTLKFRLENELPDALDVHTNTMGPQVTNLHTHGLVVSPQGNSDNVFISVLPKVMSRAVHRMNGLTYVNGAFDYAIKIPAAKIQMPMNNPAQSRAGLFWFHPHPHGLSQHQLTRGLSGLIAPGAVEDYAECRGRGGEVISCGSITRHFIMLRDFTIQKISGDDWDIVERNPASPIYCESDEHGNCPKLGSEPDKKWLFTVNGAVKPVIRMMPNETRLIRLANVGADVTYKLDIVASNGTDQLPKVQLIAKDGIAVADTEPFPMLLMPAARAEFMISAPQTSGRYVLRTIGHYTGGDEWRSAQLLEIVVGNPPAVVTARISGPRTANQRAESKPSGLTDPKAVQEYAAKNQLVAMVPRFPLKSAAVSGSKLDIEAVRNSSKIQLAPVAPPPHSNQSHTMARTSKASPSSIDPCRYERLKPGQERIIILAQVEDTKSFRIGYSIKDVDQKIIPIFEPREVDMARTDVCVKFGGEETWNVVNLGPEIHNFHIHQVKFMVSEVTRGKDPSGVNGCELVNLSNPSGTDCNVSGVVGAAGHDTFPVPPNGGSIKLHVAFKNSSQKGKFVFHCHLLEHEDRGMMAVLNLR